MSIAQRIPLLGFALSLYTGVVLASLVSVNSRLVFGLCLLFLLSILLIHSRLKRQVNVTLQWVLTLIIYWCSLFLGMLMYESSIHDSPLHESKSLLLLSDFQNVITQNGYSRFEAKGKILESRNQKREFGILCYTRSQNIDLGQKDFILAEANLKPFLSPELPHQFNAKKYYARIGVQYNTWLLNGHYILKKSALQTLEERTSAFRENAVQVFDSLGEGKAGIIKAMLVGDKVALLPEIKKGFVSSGTVHLLVVSGLHVGVVFLVVNGLLFWLKAKQLKLVMSILAIWLYLMLIGFPTPALRAAIMISLVLLGKIIGRSSYLLNSIVLSSLIIVFVNPQSLFSLSFQYSYAAVLGIITIYPILKKRLAVQDWLLSRLISLLLVSFSAQVFTTPLGIFYFNQIPVFSLLANLIILPLMLAEFYMGIVLVIFSSVLPQLNSFLFLIMDAYLELIIFVNQIIGETSDSILKLPSSYAYHIGGIYVVIILIYLGFKRRMLGSIVLGFTLISLIILKPGIETKNKLYSMRYRSKQISVYIAKHEAYIFGESQSLVDSKLYQYMLQPLLVNSRVNKEFRIPIEMMNIQQRMGEILLLKEGVFLYENKLFLMRSHMKKTSLEIEQVQKLVREFKFDLEICEGGRSNKVIGM